MFVVAEKKVENAWVRERLREERYLQGPHVEVNLLSRIRRTSVVTVRRINDIKSKDMRTFRSTLFK